MAYGEPAVITALSQFNAGRAVPSPNYPGESTPGALTFDDQGEGQITFNDVAVDSFNFSGHREPTYFDDLYFRIHFMPGQINLGNVLSVQTEEVRLWNAFLSDQEMTGYQEPSAEGMSIQAPVSPPYTLAALEELSYIVTVSVDGPPQFSEEILWTIGGVNYSVPISGQRVVVFPFGPNWSQQVTESLEWKTDVIRSFSGKEAREALRSKPRRQLAYRTTLEGNLVNQFQNILYGWQDRQYALPVWFDKWIMPDAISAGATSVPTETDGRSFFKGGLALLITDTFTFEVFEIDSIESDRLIPAKPLENDWPRLTRLYPLNLATLPSSIPTQRLTSRVLTANLEFRMDPVKTDPYLPAIPAADTHNGYEIIYRKPNWASPVQHEFESDFEMLDFDIGTFTQVQNPGFPRQMRTFQWVLKNRQDIKDFRALLGRLKGRYTPAYLPTWHSDFILADITTPGSSGLTVKHAQYDTMVDVPDTQKTLLIRLRDGTQFLRTIVGVTEQGDGTEVVSTDAEFPVEINPQNILMISLVHLCCLRQDGVTINYQSDSVSTVEITTIVVDG
ncbi:hypothetical protein [Marinobacter nauticus]|uniref:Uncharacterized protein n=1 Tax=Marinobacter nauticus TaxID=2743 RepID=A0A833N9T3_MARNT|nr:hypothetical protein [Marinobacter nauticus]KAE8546142.1 hypothetical protein F6453_1388 [Marinobacter nauticus]